MRAMDFELAGPIRRGSDTPVEGEQRRRLSRAHGRGPWRKRSTVVKVRLRDGSVHRTAVHWYSADGIGRREMKLKFPLAD